MFYSKGQNTVETSTFGSEFLALCIATGLIEALIYNLQMFVIPIYGPARMFCDNKSVVVSSSFPEETLKKKHCSIAFNKIQESVTSGKQLIVDGPSVVALSTGMVTMSRGECLFFLTHASTYKFLLYFGKR